MCAIYGFVNYKHLLNGQQIKELVRNLSIASEVRGTDASGIAYVKNAYLSVYKTPKPSHEVNFFFPSDTTILTGHTRWTTQGSAKNNCNNHPFVGKTADGSFALCHNGILRNDKELAVEYHLPKTDIKTDTYVAVQLLERHSSLCFETIAKMCETVRGDFVFTILNDDNTLFIAKGNNPIRLIHSKRLGLYIYFSKESRLRSFILIREILSASTSTETSKTIPSISLTISRLDIQCSDAGFFLGMTKMMTMIT